MEIKGKVDLTTIVEPLKVGVAYDDVIKSISYSNKEILHNISVLHNKGEGFHCDMTYSSGKFYEIKGSDEYLIPQPKIKFDVAPQFDDVIKIEPWGKLPLEDNSIQSLVIDLPFVIYSKNPPKNNDKRSSIIAKRFASYYPVSDMLANYTHWIEEAYRVLGKGGLLVFKTQATVSGGIQVMTPEYTFMEALRCGFYALDQFFLIAKQRLHSGKIKKQDHARKYTSTYWVFRKKGPKNINYYKWLVVDDVNGEATKEKVLLGFEKNIIK